MAKFFIAPGDDTAYRVNCIERVTINSSGYAVLNLESNKTVALSGEYRNVKEVLTIIKAIEDHPEYEVDWRTIADFVHRSVISERTELV